MSYFFRVLLASISISLVLPVPGNDETVIPSAGAFTTGLLWKIEAPAASSPADAPDYLFGTMHSDDPRITVIPQEVQAALTKSDSFCLEMVPDATAMMTMSRSMVFTNGKTLQGVVGDQLFARLSPLMLQRGIPAQALALFKPWAVFLTLSVPPQKTGMFLDLVLYEKAKQQQKILCGLETAEEQVDIFEETSLEDQILLLQQLVKDPQAQDQQLTQLTEKYLARDIGGLVTLSQEFDDATPQERKSAEAFLGRLIDDRNTRMVERMLPQLKQGSAFIAVGALHLSGARGMLQLLVNRGYTVSAVY